jgi:hypothetical protein
MYVYTCIYTYIYMCVYIYVYVYNIAYYIGAGGGGCSFSSLTKLLDALVQVRALN